MDKFRRYETTIQHVFHDNIDVGPLTEADLSGELFATPGNPF
jgi:hypothetical protein